MADFITSTAFAFRAPPGLLARLTIGGGAFDDEGGVATPPSGRLPPALRQDSILLPAPALLRRPVADFDERHVREHRAHVLWLRQSGKRYLGRAELRFTADLARWARPLTIDEADRLMGLVDRIDAQLRGEL